LVRLRSGLLSIAVLTALLAAPVVASGEGVANCDTALSVVRLASPLVRFGAKLARHEAVTIVAIGSSSTWGAGASTREASYPSRLEAELKILFPQTPITVLNRGVGGEEVPDMLKRFDEAVIAAKPDLVLWQLGTNSVIRDHVPDRQADLIREGLDRIRSTGAEAVLIDPQYVPKVIEKPQARLMLNVIASTAKAQNVDLFPRFEMMKHWSEADHLAFDVFTAPDGLHMNDWGYACLAKSLSIALSEAAKRPVLSAKAR
jgi:lysophospholipase L1-like esterase